MRMLFVSSTTVGGSGRSQRELATQLAALGHEVLFLVDPETGRQMTRWWYGHLSDLAVRVARSRVAPIVSAVESVPGRRSRETTIGGLPHRSSPVPENAARKMIATFSPDVVVGSSIARLAWRKIRRMCIESGIPTVLYIREDVALNHFDGGSNPADAIVANAESLARAVRQMGIDCAFIPSVIDTDVTATDSSRRVALVINPIASRGVDVVFRIAERLPTVPFVLQESWPLESDQLELLKHNMVHLPNIELRRSAPPGPHLYDDARVLLVPYRVDNRPRVIAEAQANGIPVVAADVSALVEAVGQGGIVVGPDDIDQWCRALSTMWEDEDAYGVLAEAARVHSTREEISVLSVARQFEEVASRLVSSTANEHRVV